MQRLVRRILAVTACVSIVLAFSGAALGQYYTFADLTSNLAGKKNIDPLLENPWGLARSSTSPFWVSDEASGYSTIYGGTGAAYALQVLIPALGGQGNGAPTGIVYNRSSEFAINGYAPIFLFANLDGSICGWTGSFGTVAEIVTSRVGAVYTGLAVSSNASENHLYAVDFANNEVDMYDSELRLTRSFVDPGNTVGYRPFGIQDIAGRVYVAYAKTAATAGGFISVFAEDGTYIKRLVRGAPLNQPWGMAVAPSNFGPLSGTLLVANHTKGGIINGFNMKTGALVGTVKNMAGNPIRINGLRGIEFGGGAAANGETNQLFFTAGPADTDGFFGVIKSH